MFEALKNRWVIVEGRYLNRERNDPTYRVKLIDEGKGDMNHVR